MIAVLPVRAGELPPGASSAFLEAGGRTLVAGEAAQAAAEALGSELGGTEVSCCELVGAFSPRRYAAALSPSLASEDAVVLPASPDGRDLAPHLAVALGRPLFAGALAVTPPSVHLVRHGGRQVVTLDVDGPFVATLLQGARSSPAGTSPRRAASKRVQEPKELEPAEVEREREQEQEANPDPELLALLEPDPSSIDLAEADRIVVAGAGAGLESRDDYEAFQAVARYVDASVGATRVVTDSGIVEGERQIGTTGVSVRPRLYVAFGVSGAAQHLGGLGDPEHVISLNIDEGCPMMAMADLAIVSDAPATLRALARQLASLKAVG